ncbi:hypothetical protein JYU34_003787 [Plutella xylostella]|uniref:Uncharacterized protein n=1 Tax=Plutella xylostella TaxID=51655 RepID=A0ABQ7R0Z4_PLUXY|nr:hypothetical protein JYU34_003787 [Plutella xylostella]
MGGSEISSVLDDVRFVIILYSGGRGDGGVRTQQDSRGRGDDGRAVPLHRAGGVPASHRVVPELRRHHHHVLRGGQRCSLLCQLRSRGHPAHPSGFLLQELRGHHRQPALVPEPPGVRHSCEERRGHQSAVPGAGAGVQRLGAAGAHPTAGRAAARRLGGHPRRLGTHHGQFSFTISAPTVMEHL